MAVQRMRNMASLAFAFILMFSTATALLPNRAALAADAPTVLILPLDQANFLPGAKFDVQIEVWADKLTDDFAVKINGKDAAEVLGAKLTSETCTAGNSIPTYKKLR